MYIRYEENVIKTKYIHKFSYNREENDVVPKVVEAILNLPENTHIAVRYTSILLLGELCEWIDRHPQSLGKTSINASSIQLFQRHSNVLCHFRTSFKFPPRLFKSKGFRKCRFGRIIEYMYSLSVAHDNAFLWTFANSTFSRQFCYQ